MRELIRQLCSASAAMTLSTSALASQPSSVVWEPVIVTASRIATPSDDLAQSVTVVEPSEAERVSGTPVYELLRSVPGVHVVNTGGAGQSTTVQIRGANSEQTLVLLDGVPMNDPTNPGRGFDFAQLTAQEVERIEVLRGAQSGVYGNNSTGGVIQIITRRLSSRSSASLRADYGSFNTRKISGTAGSRFGKTNWSASGNYEASDGFPSANEASGNTLKNGYSRFTASLALDQKFSHKIEGKLTARAYRADTSLPYNGGPPGASTGQDPNYTGNDTQAAVGTQVRHTGFVNWEPSLGFGLTLVSRRFDNDPDALHSDMLRERYQGRRLKIDQSNTVSLNPKNTLAFGVDTQIETITVSQDYGSGPAVIDGRSQAVSGVFSEYRWDGQSAFFTAAARADHFHGHSDQLTYRFGPGYRLIHDTLLAKASVGRGFKFPSLFQLYSNFGNSDLSPEVSLSWDAGVEYAQHSRGGVTKTSFTYFQSHFSDLIDFQSGKYVNTRSADTQGVELSISNRFNSGSITSLGYTYQSAKNAQTGASLARRPSHQATARVSHPVTAHLNLGLSVRFTGSRSDVDPAPPNTPVQMPSYTIFDIDASWKLSQGYQAFSRLGNALDRNYEEVAGYGAARRAIYFGLQKEL